MGFRWASDLVPITHPTFQRPIPRVSVGDLIPFLFRCPPTRHRVPGHPQHVPQLWLHPQQRLKTFPVQAVEFAAVPGDDGGRPHTAVKDTCLSEEVSRLETTLGFLGFGAFGFWGGIRLGSLRVLEVGEDEERGDVRSVCGYTRNVEFIPQSSMACTAARPCVRPRRCARAPRQPGTCTCGPEVPGVGCAGVGMAAACHTRRVCVCVCVRVKSFNKKQFIKFDVHFQGGKYQG